MRHGSSVILACGLVAASVAVAHAQVQGAQDSATSHAAAMIEIQGQVPTPQVVTVRPRQVPEFDRRVLGAERTDHTFWPSILAGYQLVSREELEGVTPVESYVPPVPARDTARQAEIDAIAKELEYRKTRLDSLERSIRNLGTPTRTSPDRSKETRPR